MELHLEECRDQHVGAVRKQKRKHEDVVRQLCAKIRIQFEKNINTATTLAEERSYFE